MRILDSARRHGVDDAAMSHAARHAMAQVWVDNDVLLLLGADLSGRLLEIGVVDLHGDDPVIHAMPMRRRFQGLLPKETP
jgi:hypothetical protein